MRALVVSLDALCALREICGPSAADPVAAATLAMLAGCDAVRLGVNDDGRPANEADLRVTVPKTPNTPVAAERTQTLPLPTGTDNRLPMAGTLLTRQYRGQNIQVMILDQGTMVLILPLSILRGYPKFMPSPEISRRYCRPRRSAHFSSRIARIFESSR